MTKENSPLSVAPNSPVRRIAGNMGRLLSGKAAAGVISLGSIAIAARVLGVEQYGVLNLVHGFATLMGGTIAFSGFHGMVRYGAEALNRGAHSQFRNLVLLLALIELGMAAVAIALAMLLVPWVGASLGWSSEAIQFGGIYCLAIFATVRATPQGLLQLAERFDLIGLHPTIMPLIRLAGALAIYFTGGGLGAFLWVWLAAAIAEGVSMWVLCWIGTRHLAISADGRPTLKGTRRENPGIVRFIATTNLDLTLRDIAPKATPLIIGWMLGPAAAGLYALVQRASAILIQPAQMLGEAAYPVVTRLLISGDDKAAGRAVRRSAIFATITALVAAAIMSVFADRVLILLGGASFAGGASLLILVVLGRAMMAGMPTLSAALTAQGRPWVSARANLASNIGMLPLLPVIIWWLGLNGAGVHGILQSAVLVSLLIWSYYRSSLAPRTGM
ncbi:lipopolysaccharide biosynthesis protein [Sphingorhabdus sp.]|uniref:lipopolysaccharide biosynthesis protein n=1 Tax=Sphingorhabdus sp. TaxID=1902408 RepID=UPI00391AC42C